ncbi:Protein cornichon-4, partial [Galemys pyrenaicus]
LMLLEIKQVGSSRTDGPHCCYCMNAPFIALMPRGKMGMLDPMEIHSQGQTESHAEAALVNLGFRLLCLFTYLYSMILV